MNLMLVAIVLFTGLGLLSSRIGDRAFVWVVVLALSIPVLYYARPAFL